MMYVIQYRQDFHYDEHTFRDEAKFNDYLNWVKSGEEGNRFVDEKDIVAVWKIREKNKYISGYVKVEQWQIEPFEA